LLAAQQEALIKKGNRYREDAQPVPGRFGTVAEHPVFRTGPDHRDIQGVPDLTVMTAIGPNHRVGTLDRGSPLSLSFDWAPVPRTLKSLATGGCSAFVIYVKPGESLFSPFSLERGEEGTRSNQ
jgi:hypothetical protein